MSPLYMNSSRSRLYNNINHRKSYHFFSQAGNGTVLSDGQAHVGEEITRDGTDCCCDG